MSGWHVVVQATYGGNNREQDWECREPSWQNRYETCSRVGYGVNPPECPDHRKPMVPVTS